MGVVGWKSGAAIATLAGAALVALLLLFAEEAQANSAELVGELPVPACCGGAVNIDDTLHAFSHNSTLHWTFDTLSRQAANATPTPQPLGSRVAYGGGKVWGSGAGSNLKVWDPATNTVTDRLTASSDRKALLWWEGKLVIFGSDVRTHDPSSGAESVINSGPGKCCDQVVSNGGKAYGAFSGPGIELFVINPSTGVITPVPHQIETNWNIYGSLWARNDKIYALGIGRVVNHGDHDNNLDVWSTSRIILEIDSVTGAVKDLNATLPQRARAQMVVSESNRAWLVGGLGSGSTVTAEPIKDIVEFDPDKQQIKVQFFATPRYPYRNTDVTFESTVSATIGNVLRLEWEFGDGTTSATAHPVHKYREHGPMLVRLHAYGDRGGKGLFMLTVNVQNAPPVAEAVFPPSPLPIGHPIEFRSNSTDPDGEVVNTTWRFHDGAPLHGTTVTRSFTQGTFLFVLEVTDNDGRTAYAEYLIRVGINAPPVAAFSVTPSNGRLDEEFVFVDQSIVNELRTRIFDFGDGKKAFTPRATHRYVSPGLYTVTLFIEDQRGLKNWTSRQVYVTPLDIGFRFEPVEPIVGEEVRFTDISPELHKVRNRRWSFGDGGTSTELNPVHRFTSAGVYPITLTFDREGVGTRSTAMLLTVRAGAPMAAFVFEPSEPTTADTVRFVDKSSGLVLRHYWDFGDGEASDRTAPYHRYRRPGDYEVKLIIEGEEGVTSTARATIHVEATSNDPPYALFVHQYDAAQRARVRFFDSSADDDGSVHSWTWDWGDGQRTHFSVPVSAEDLRPFHDYRQPGNYTVVLLVTDDRGATSIQDAQVTIRGAPPTAAFIFDPVRPKVDQEVLFRPEGSRDSDGLLNRYSWTFGDVSLGSSDRAASHRYAAPGTYSVTLIVSDNDGYTATATGYVTVEERPVMEVRTEEPAGLPGFHVGLLVASFALAAYLRRR